MIALSTNITYSAENINSDNKDSSLSITIVENDTASHNKYKVMPGDILTVSVYNEPDFVQPEIVVRPDGYATIDPIGEVYVEGYDVQEITQLLQSMYKKFVNDPIVSVNIKEMNAPSVYILGAVQKPGTYQQMTTVSKYYSDSKNPTVRTDLTLTNVISNAGGISDDADLSNITVTSLDKKETRINLWKFIKDGDISQNVKLRSGDVIFVPKIDTITINDEDFKLLSKTALFPASFPVRVVGEVQKVGTFNLTGESPYISTAIADASGYTLEGKKSVVVVYRKAGNDKFSKIYVSPFEHDFVLRPNDLVEVRKRTFMKCVFGADYLARLLSPFNVIPEIGNSWADLVNPHRRYYYGY
jgi:polysaccharide biosynthesis/export protein